MIDLTSGKTASALSQMAASQIQIFIPVLHFHFLFCYVLTEYRKETVVICKNSSLQFGLWYVFASAPVPLQKWSLGHQVSLHQPTVLHHSDSVCLLRLWPWTLCLWLASLSVCTVSQCPAAALHLTASTDGTSAVRTQSPPGSC